MPDDMVDTGVHYDAGEARRGRGPAFFRTGENFNGEDRGRVLRPREPAQQMDISDQGENLMALLGPFMDQRMAALIDKRLNDFMRNPPRMPPTPSPAPAMPPLDEEIENLPVPPETKAAIRSASPSMQRAILNEGEKIIRSIARTPSLDGRSMTRSRHTSVAPEREQDVAMHLDATGEGTPEDVKDIAMATYPNLDADPRYMSVEEWRAKKDDELMAGYAAKYQRMFGVKNETVSAEPTVPAPSTFGYENEGDYDMDRKVIDKKFDLN